MTALCQDTAGTGLARISVINALSGGVIIAIGFLHFLPQAQEGLHQLNTGRDFHVCRRDTTGKFHNAAKCLVNVDGVVSWAQ